MKGPDKNITKEILKTVVFAFLAVLIIRFFFLQAYLIPSSSMEDTFKPKDRVLVNKILYGFRIPLTYFKLFAFKHIKKGDIVVFISPNEPEKDFIKRCAGAPGDTVEIKDKILFVNGKPAQEPYIKHADSRLFKREEQPRDNYGPAVIPESYYFMMGDNRDFSNDSRFWGLIHEKYIIGEPVLRYWPLNRFKPL